ncbi:hypothetical protein [Streptomyces sp. NPDC049906]|uniref:hypothetical protein n=1 Tax=Streptomyces sp. NPDC049906 TaxID=3155656 RepID=UPI00343A60E2
MTGPATGPGLEALVVQEDNPWAKPWPGPSSAQARAVFHAPEAHHLDPAQQELFYAEAWAAQGYTYRPDPQRLRPQPPAHLWVVSR